MPGPHHILCVDDEPMIREILREALEQEGHRISEAENGKVALEKVHSGDYDLIVTDVKMPVMDGFTLMKNLGGLTEQIPVVVITSFGDIDVAVDAIRLGAYDYIVKPFNISQVTISVKRALERRQLLLENIQYKKSLEHKVVEKTIDLIRKNKKLEQQAKLLEGLLRDLRESYEASLDAMVSAIESRDCETKHHCRRVQVYAVMLAQRLDVSPEQLVDISYGSLLHDVGKIGVPDSILLKPGKLTDSEWEVMRRHTIIGHQMISKIKFLRGASDIVLHHHERWDGGGYPNGISGEEIPLGARIFSIIDTYDAMTSKRPYKEALPIATARKEIERCAGTQFDPRIVKEFLRISDGDLMEARAGVETESAAAAAAAPVEPVEPVRIF
ncbi:MAG TPA: HD domain-containing phosphohydrolase [Planctomycetota bacterium]|nr:HD domain-containing phosphohydrolase [Planctomycetota bacterium]